MSSSFFWTSFLFKKRVLNGTYLKFPKHIPYRIVKIAGYSFHPRMVRVPGVVHVTFVNVCPVTEQLPAEQQLFRMREKMI